MSALVFIVDESSIKSPLSGKTWLGCESTNEFRFDQQRALGTYLHISASFA